MGPLLARRLVRLVVTLFVVSLFSFFLLDLLPGDTCRSVLPPDAQNDPAVYQRCRDDLRLDDSIVVRYADWAAGAVRLDLGFSYVKKVDVIELIRDKIPVTFELALVSVGMALVASLPLGVFAAYREGRLTDRFVSGLTLTFLSIPAFVVGLYLIVIFAVKLGKLPATGWTRPTESILENIRTVILPASSLALAEIAVYIRLIRADMIGTLQEDYIFTAKAKGISNMRVLFRHALRPSSLSLITVVGLNIGTLLGGTVVIEQLFAIPGLGRTLFEAVTQRDYLVVQGIAVLLSAIYVMINFFVDLIYMVVDPRIRQARMMGA